MKAAAPLAVDKSTHKHSQTYDNTEGNGHPNTPLPPACRRQSTNTLSHTWQMKTLLASKHKCYTHLGDMRRQRFSPLGGTSVNFSR